MRAAQLCVAAPKSEWGSPLLFMLGPPVVPVYPKIDCRKKKRYPYSNLSTGGPSSSLATKGIYPW